MKAIAESESVRIDILNWRSMRYGWLLSLVFTSLMISFCMRVLACWLLPVLVFIAAQRQWQEHVLYQGAQDRSSQGGLAYTARNHADNLMVFIDGAAGCVFFCGC